MRFRRTHAGSPGAVRASRDLTGALATRESNEKYLSNLVATCEHESTDVESKIQLRPKGLEATAKAIELLSAPRLLLLRGLPALVRRAHVPDDFEAAATSLVAK